MQIFLPAGDLGHWWFLPPSASETHLSQCQYSARQFVPAEANTDCDKTKVSVC